MSGLSINDGYRVASSAWAGGLRRPPRVTVSEWADQNRILTQTESAEPGPWRTSRVPYMREIMDSLSAHSLVQRVVFIKSTQVAGTEAILNWIGSVIDRFPAPMLAVMPTIDVGQMWSKTRLTNMISECKALSSKIAPSRSRDSGNTTLLKEFPGGMLRIGGANSAVSLRSMPIKYLSLDEVDGYPDDIDGEGDPVGLAEERTNNFARRKVFLVSTPTIKGASRIEDEYEKSDRRRYFVPCPDCHGKQHLKWSNVRWNKELTRAWYICEHCGVEIEEHHKTWMLENGEWIAEYPDRLVRGYHLNTLYSPLGLGRTWLERARQWIDCQSDHIRLKRFVNTALGETWEDRSSQLKADELKERAEPFRLRTIPIGCLLLTAGVDTQDDRLEVQILGWGRNESCWVLDRVVLPGSPATSAPWEALDKLLLKPIHNQFGIPMRIEATAIDTGGHHTHEVYHFCRTRISRRVMAIKGVSTPNRAILGRPTLQDVEFDGKTIKDGVQLWPIGTDTAKSTLTGRLLADAELPITQRRIHFSQQLDLDYYEQLTAEAFDPERNRWVPRRGRRNEALDTWVYGYAAAMHPDLRIHVARETDWLKLEQLLEPLSRDMFAEQNINPPDSEIDLPTKDPAPAGSSLLQQPNNATGDSDWLGDTSDFWS